MCYHLLCAGTRSSRPTLGKGSGNSWGEMSPPQSSGCFRKRVHGELSTSGQVEAAAVTRSLLPQPRFLEARLDPAGQARGRAELGLLLWPTRAGDSDDDDGAAGKGRWQSSNRRERFGIVRVGCRDREERQRMGSPGHLPGSSGAPPSPPLRRFLPNREGKTCLFLCSCQEIFFFLLQQLRCRVRPSLCSRVRSHGDGFPLGSLRMGQHQSEFLWHSGVTLGQ